MPEEIAVPVETQEEPAAPPVEAQPPTEPASEEPQEPQETKPKGGFQKKIDKLTREKADAAREAEFWRQQALRTAPVETPKEPKGEPSENDFQTHAEYVKALTKWTAAQAVEEFKAQQRTESAKTEKQTAVQAFQAREQAFRDTTPDFDEVLAEAEDVQVSNALIEEIVASDHGPALKYFLAKNPDEAKRLSGLGLLALAREVGRIESRFTSPSPKTVKTTAAPPPPTPASKSSPTSTKDPGDMSPAEYKAWRAKQ